MSKLITTTFAIVGVFTGFALGLVVATGGLSLRDGNEAKAMSVPFGMAITFAILFGWGASTTRDRIPEQYREALGSVGLVLALASAIFVFSSIQ